MKQVEEKISSVRRMVQMKRVERGLTSPMLMVQSLKKYHDLSTIKFPKSVTQAYRYRFLQDATNRFGKPEFTRLSEIPEQQYIFEKMVQNIAKMIVEHVQVLEEKEAMLLDKETLTEEELNYSFPRELSRYLEEFKLDGIHFRLIGLITEENKQDRFGQQLITTYGKFIPSYLWAIEFEYGEDYPTYCSFEGRIPTTKIGSYKGVREYRNTRGAIRDAFSLLAMQLICSGAQDFLTKNPEQREKIKQKVSRSFMNHSAFQTAFDELLVDGIPRVLSENRGIMPDVMKFILNHTLEEMIGLSMTFLDFEEREMKNSGDYATTYMTKKNIPQKIQAFMENNEFLKVFDYVEADELCDLDKLNGLSQQFPQFMEHFPLQFLNDYSFRFRRLGKLHAAGVHYPDFKTIAVDLDQPSAFAHEVFHAIDFTHGLLSMDQAFQPIVDRYKMLSDQMIKQLPSEHEIVEKWNKTTSKFSKLYYQAHDEIFARMGEIYVAKILGIDSSFNQSHFNTLIFDPSKKETSMEAIKYPLDEELLALVKTYYDELFTRLQSENTTPLTKDESSSTDEEEASDSAVDSVSETAEETVDPQTDDSTEVTDSEEAVEQEKPLVEGIRLKSRRHSTEFVQMSLAF